VSIISDAIAGKKFGRRKKGSKKEDHLKTSSRVTAQETETRAVGTEEQKENQVSSEPINDEEATAPADLGVENIDLPFLDADDGEIELLPLLTPPASSTNSKLQPFDNTSNKFIPPLLSSATSRTNSR